MEYIFLKMEKSETICYTGHDSDYTCKREMRYFCVKTAIGTVVSYNDEVFFFIEEEELSCPEKIVMFHGGEEHTLISDFLVTDLSSLYHFDRIFLVMKVKS